MPLVSLINSCSLHVSIARPAVIIVAFFKKNLPGSGLHGTNTERHSTIPQVV